MEKKIIDLRDCKGEEVEILFPEKENVIILEETGTPNKIRFKMKQDYLFGLVPKSWSDLDDANPLVHSFVVESYTDDDHEAFEALAKLRMLWHEWVEVLGYHDIHDNGYGIWYDRDIDTIKCNSMTGPLIFKEQSHTEKFIECFGELLEKAKILL